MRETIKTKELKIGMYVVLPGSWFKHPFLTNELLIKSQEQIDTIIEFGIDELAIDPEKGTPVTETESISHGPEAREVTPPKKWDPEKLVPPELREAIRDKTLPPQKKSKLVYRHSLQLMERLFEDPKTENIRAAKKGIAEIVDLVISDDATSDQLLKITSYDFYTYTHSVNVGVLSILLSKALFKGSDAHDMHELGAGFFLHDIGKVRVDPAIINKPGKLTGEEMMKMRTHPYQGYKILSEADQLTEECKVIVMQHHEREDGTGYPRRLKGDEIHTYGRIGCIADVYDAITAERSYKLKIDTFHALKIMKEQLLNHFHPDIFERFVLLFAERMK